MSRVLSNMRKKKTPCRKGRTVLGSPAGGAVSKADGRGVPVTGGDLVLTTSASLFMISFLCCPWDSFFLFP